MASDYIKSIVEQACKAKFKELAPKKAIEYANQLRDIAGPLVEAEVKSVGGGDMAIGVPSMTDMNAEIRLSFYSDLHRDSLWSSRYGGVDNIVNLFEHGWNARGRVRGYWRGRGFVWSRRAHPAGNMLGRAVATFNNSAPNGVQATLLGPYA